MWQTNKVFFFWKINCKTVGFFLKISKEFGKAWRMSLQRAKRASLTRPQGVWGERQKTSLPILALCFQPRSRPFAWLLARTWKRKNTDCFAVYSKNENRINWYGWPNKITAGLNGFRSLIFDCNNFLQREPKRQLLRDGKSNQGAKVTLKRRNVLRHWSMVVQSYVRNPLQPIMLIFWNAIGSKVRDTSLACSESIMLRRCRQRLEGQIHQDTSCIRMDTWQVVLNDVEDPRYIHDK